MDKFMGRELLSFIGIDKLKELYEKSTRVVSWYAHSQYDGYHPGKASVRGPYGRWMLIEGGSNGMGDEKKYPTPVADLILLATEARDLMGNPRDWKALDGVIPRYRIISPWSPEDAKDRFLQRYSHIMVKMSEYYDKRM